MWQQARRAQLHQQEQQRRQDEKELHHGPRGRGRGGWRGGGGGRPWTPRGSRGGSRGGWTSCPGDRGGANQRHHNGRGGYVQRGGRGYAQKTPPGHHDRQQQQQPRRPWVDFRLQSELWLRDSLQRKAAASKSAEDNDRFTAQRDKVARLEAELMAEYFRLNPREEERWLPILAKEASTAMYYCEVCEKEFRLEKELKEHEAAHEVCELEGCRYVADKETMEEHILIIHASGLYARMVHGNSKEDVDKWKQQRKSHYPTLEQIARAEAKKAVKRMQREMQQRRLEEETEARTVLYREQKKKFKQRMRQMKNKEREGENAETEILDREPEGGRSAAQRNRERKKKRIAEMETHGVGRKSQLKPRPEFSDDSEPEDFCQGVHMFAGISIEDDPSQDRDAAASQIHLEIEDDDYDDGPPEEVAIERTNESAEEVGNESHEIQDASMANTPEKTSSQPLPRSKCRKRQRQRERQQQGGQNGGDGRPTNNSWLPAMPLLPLMVPDSELPIKLVRRSQRPPTLLEKMLTKDMREERTEILQCVKFVCENNFFDD